MSSFSLNNEDAINIALPCYRGNVWHVINLISKYLTQLYVFTPLLLIVFPEDDTIGVIAW